MIDSVVHIVPKRRDRTHWLYVGVIAAVIAGVVVGLVAPQVGKAVGVLGTMFVSLIKMMIGPVIFCTIVLGVGAVRKAATVGKIGGLAFGYFLVMTTFALGIGLVVGNLLHPGNSLKISASMTGKGADLAGAAHESGGAVDFFKNIIPTTLFSALTAGNVLQALFVALLVGFAIQALGSRGEPMLRAVEHLQVLVFKILTMVLWVAPIGAFGAMANVVGQTGWSAVRSLIMFMGGFYLTCFIFVFGFGVQQSTVGIVVPTGYSFNLDGTAIYLTMASLFIADVMGSPMSLSQQLGLLAFMIVASKGAAGVSGAGLATLAGGLQAHRPDLLDGVGLIVGVDRFMSEARSVTNFSGNAVATLLIGCWTSTVDKARVDEVLSGRDPFDEIAMLDDHSPQHEATGRRGETTTAG